MSDLLSLITHAWETRVKPRLDRDADELARRLGRRRSKMMRRPVRAWCLAVRASDRRINPATAACSPEVAALPAAALVGRYQGHVLYERHTVTLTAPLLRRLCRPTAIPFPGLDTQALGREMGVDPGNFRAARRSGAVSTRLCPGLGGRSGNPVPVLFARRLLDPSAQLFSYADPLWGTTGRYVADHVPDDLEQTLVRVPVWWQARRWTVPFGYDRREGFGGWRWVCPACGRTRRTLYCPLPPLRIVRLLRREFHDVDPNHPDAWPAPQRAFACVRCHDLLYFTRFGADKWNHLISHLTGGLMYGHEVPRPAWYQPARQRPFRPRLRGRPSQRREEVLAGLVSGMSYRRLALRLGVSPSTVNTHARTLFRMYHVEGVAALRRQFAPRPQLNDGAAVSAAAQGGRALGRAWAAS